LAILIISQRKINPVCMASVGVHTTLDVVLWLKQHFKTYATKIVEDSATVECFKSLVSLGDRSIGHDYYHLIRGERAGLALEKFPVGVEFAERVRLIDENVGRYFKDTTDSFSSFFMKDKGDSKSFYDFCRMLGINAEIGIFHGCHVMQEEHGLVEYRFSFLHFALGDGSLFSDGSKELLFLDDIVHGPMSIHELPAFSVVNLGPKLNFLEVIACFFDLFRRARVGNIDLFNRIGYSVQLIRFNKRDLVRVYRNESGFKGLVYPIGYVCTDADHDPIKL